MDRDEIFKQILAERDRQDHLWGKQSHGNGRWLIILIEEIGEIAQSLLHSDYVLMRQELIQTMAVGVAWLESWDDKERKPR